MAHPERGLADTELTQAALTLAGRFVQRWDRYARQLPSGLYVAINEPLTVEQLYAHLRGELTLGAYLLDPANQARFLVFDADSQPAFDQLRELAANLEAQGTTTYPERSRRGGHLWFFFSEPKPGTQVRQFGQGIVAAHSLAKVELYPKQGHLSQGPGSLIRMPFGVHQVTGQRYGFMTPQGDWLAPTVREQIKQFVSPKTISPLTFDCYRGLVPMEEDQPDFDPLDTPTDTVSGRIKAAMPVLEFVGQYIDLRPTARGGVGRCPFHEDERPSFGVNAEKNYWYCFAGCGGGSIIDFFMKWRNCEFQAAVKELAEMLL